jgi:hypothetical protein
MPSEEALPWARYLLPATNHGLGLVTERASIVMRTADGTIVEVFEWVSREAIEGAHKNPVVLDLWKQFEAVCWYETPSNLPQSSRTCSRILRPSEVRCSLSTQQRSRTRPARTRRETSRAAVSALAIAAP